MIIRTSTVPSFDAFQVMGSIVALVGIIVIGVVLGITLGRHGNKSSSSSGNSSNSSDLSDPSSFQKDPRLFQSFYGISYTPTGSQYPACGNSLGGYIFEPFIIYSEHRKITTRCRYPGRSSMFISSPQDSLLNHF